MTTWKIKARNVNSKLLYKEVTAIIQEGLTDMGILWSSDSHREAWTELLDEMLEEAAIAGYIEQWKVLCDLRNNSVDDMEQNIYIFDVYYKQTNCLNTTHLQYRVEDEDEEFMLDFTL